MKVLFLLWAVLGPAWTAVVDVPVTTEDAAVETSTIIVASDDVDSSGVQAEEFNLKSIHWIGANSTEDIIPESPVRESLLSLQTLLKNVVNITVDETNTNLRTQGNADYCRCVNKYYCTAPQRRPLRTEKAINTPLCQRDEVMCCRTGGPGCGVTDPFPPFHPYPSYGEANYAEYPWTAMVMDTSNQYIFGLGVIVSPGLVLTAARNLEPYIGTPLKIRVGEWDLSSNDEPFRPVEVTVKEAILHPQFNKRTFQNDIALLKLRTPLDLASYPQIRSACLGRPEDLARLSNSKCWTAGWGNKPSERQRDARNLLKEVDMKMVDPASCEAAIRRSIGNPQYYFDQRSFVCAGGEAGKGVCKGDEGAALVCQETPQSRIVVVGLASWGTSCGQAGFPGIFTNLATQYEWIRSTDSSVG